MKPKTQVKHKIIKRDKSQVSPIKQQKETTMQGTQKINIIQKKIIPYISRSKDIYN